MKFKVVIIRPGIWGLTKKDLRDAGREAMRPPLVRWHNDYKPLHFQKFAVAKYGYKPNTAAYERRKRKEHPEAQGRPMVWTGDSERRALASKGVTVSATSFERFTGKAQINAPTLNYQRLADQVTRLTEHEYLVLQNDFARGFTANFLAIADDKAAPITLTAA